MGMTQRGARHHRIGDGRPAPLSEDLRPGDARRSSPFRPWTVGHRLARCWPAGRMIVVIGTHGERPLMGVVLGSTPYKLLHRSPVPVLVVRVPDEA